MYTLLGWKDILRPIRDGYRHLFPAPDTWPTPEQRKKQRELDRLKGFAYFDTFDQIERWTARDSDPIQRANTPLLARSRTAGSDSDQKAAVLLCHDYSGNYHDYESVQGTGIDEEFYTCEYLQYVDKFVYFSHKLVCIPPPSWTNTLHRNGVQALGTILIESQTKDPGRLLSCNQSTDTPESKRTFPLAQKLAGIAEHYGFDGYLVNIEKSFSDSNWDPSVLESFLRQLKEDLGASRSLIWYDALTIENKVSYQNALTLKNVVFSQACGQILTNYSWREADALSSRQLASTCGELDFENVVFGVDAWAQNKAPLTRRRVTYPEHKGGGTYCGIAVEKLSKIGLSVGIFAPAWTFEHFPGQARKIEKAVWEGAPFDEVSCTCGDAHIQHPPNRGRHITRAARVFPAGSDNFFYTDFSRGFGRHAKLEAGLYGGKLIHSQLSCQSILPQPSKDDRDGEDIANATNILSYDLEDIVGQTQLIINVRSVTSQNVDERQSWKEAWLPLYSLDMATHADLRLQISFRVLLKATDAYPSFFLEFSNGRQTIPCSHDNLVEFTIQPPHKTGTGGRLLGIGIHLRAPYISAKKCRIMEVESIKIMPRYEQTLTDTATIDDLKIVESKYTYGVYWRLCWTYTGDKPAAHGLPYSAVTGPFAYFSIWVDGLSIGRAHALEHVLPDVLMKDRTDDEVSVEVIGIGFDGGEVARRCLKLRHRNNVK
ncbi:unnamed protein product [Periconia digitata]|uniref:Cytosolic endo-beta-N-acetylglucosaminidase TIM barrel domain-containing protein n=1 Tax=Periconia digitata TaxID=1303443 RepID=A0A9W4UFE9_9PLEO|nr:unnamed protein product [Periconia digitata]